MHVSTRNIHNNKTNTYSCESIYIATKNQPQQTGNINEMYAKHASSLFLSKCKYDPNVLQFTAHHTAQYNTILLHY